MKMPQVNLERRKIDEQAAGAVQWVGVEPATEGPAPTWPEAAVCFEGKTEGVWVAEVGRSVQFVRGRFCTDDATIIAALRAKAGFGIREVEAE